MNNRILKVPKGAYRRANEKGVLNVFKLFYVLKSINVEGYLKRGSVIALVQDKCTLSEPSIRRGLKKLEELGLVSRTKGSVLISSYNKLWRLLGYNLAKLPILFKIDSDNFLNKLYAYEISWNLKSQKREASRKHIIKEHGSDADVTDGEISYFVDIYLPKEEEKQIDYIRKNKCFNGINYEATLTCEGIAKLFGYKTPMSGFVIERKVEKAGYFNIERRKPVFFHSVRNELDFNRLSELRPKTYKSCYLYKNKVYKKFPNMLKESEDFNPFERLDDCILFEMEKYD